MAEQSPSGGLPKGGGKNDSGNRRDENTQKTAGDEHSQTQYQSRTPGSTPASGEHNPSKVTPSTTDLSKKDGKNGSNPDKNKTSQSGTKGNLESSGENDNQGKIERSLSGTESEMGTPDTSNNNSNPDSNPGKGETSSADTKSDSDASDDHECSGLADSEGNKPLAGTKSDTGKSDSVSGGKEDATTHTVTAPDGGVSNVKPIRKDKPHNLSESTMEQVMAGSKVTGRDQGPAAKTRVQEKNPPEKKGKFVQDAKQMFEDKTNSGGETAYPRLIQSPHTSALKKHVSTHSAGPFEDQKDVIAEGDFVVVPVDSDIDPLDDQKSDDGDSPSIETLSDPEQKQADIYEIVNGFKKLDISDKSEKNLPTIVQPEHETDLDEGTEKGDNMPHPNTKNTIGTENASVDETLKRPQTSNYDGMADHGDIVLHEDDKPLMGTLQKTDGNTVGQNRPTGIDSDNMNLHKQTNLQQNPNKDVTAIADKNDNKTERFMQQETENEKTDGTDMSNKPSAMQISPQPEQEKDETSLNATPNNDGQSAKRMMGNDDKTGLEGTNDQKPCAEQSPSIKGSCNENPDVALYGIEKHGKIWCIRDTVTQKLYPQKHIIAKDIQYESKELVIVDDAFYQVRLSSKGLPMLEKCEDIDLPQSGPESVSKHDTLTCQSSAQKGQLSSLTQQNKLNEGNSHKKSHVGQDTSADFSSSTNCQQKKTTQVEPPDIKEESETDDYEPGETSSLTETAGALPDTNAETSQPPAVPPRGYRNTRLTSNQSSSRVDLEVECQWKMVKTDVFRNAFKSKFPSSEFFCTQYTNGTSVTFQCGVEALEVVQKWFEHEIAVDRLEFSKIKRHRYVQRLGAVIDMFMNDRYNEHRTVFWTINETTEYIQFCTVGEPTANDVRSDLTNALKKVTLKCENSTKTMLATLQAELQKTIKLCAVVIEEEEFVIIHTDKNKSEKNVIDLAQQILNSVDKIIKILCKGEGKSALDKLVAENQMNINIAKVEDLKCMKWTFPKCQTVQLLVGQGDFVGFVAHIRIISDEKSAKEGFESDKSTQSGVLNIYERSTSVKKKLVSLVESMFTEADKLNLEKICVSIPNTREKEYDLKYLLNSLWRASTNSFDKMLSFSEIIFCCQDDHIFLQCEHIFAAGSNCNMWYENCKLEPLKVTVVQGNLAATKADVLVNSIGQNLNLKSGYVSNQLLTQAGPKLQSAVCQKKKQINAGELIETESFNMETCKFIFHGAVGVCCDTEGKQINEEDELLKDMKKLIIDCLEAADAKQLTSIAFPALGTGKAGFTVTKVAQTMFEAIEYVWKKLDFVKEIMIVINPENHDHFIAFQAEKDKWLNTAFWYRISSAVLRCGNMFCKAVCALPQFAPFNKCIYILSTLTSGGVVSGTKRNEIIRSDGSERGTSEAFGDAFKLAVEFNEHTVGIFVDSTLMTSTIGKQFCQASAMMGRIFQRPLRVTLVFSEAKWCKDTFVHFEQDNVKVVFLTAKGSMNEIHGILQILKKKAGIEVQEMTGSAREEAQMHNASNQEGNGTKPKKNNSLLVKHNYPTEPPPLTMGRNPSQCRMDMLQAGYEEKIVLVDGIKDGITENKLKEELHGLISSYKHQVVFNEGTTKALIVFDKESDTKSLLRCKSEMFQIKSHPCLAIYNCSYVVAKQEVENNFIFKYLHSKKFQRPYFTCEDINGSVKITSQTSYGVEYIRFSLKDYVCRTYSIESELKRLVLLGEMCGSELFGMSNIDGDLYCDRNSVTMVCRSRALEKNDRYINKILKFEAEKEFPLKVEHVEKAEGWCNELESDGCISTVLKDESKLIVLVERYDNVLKVTKKIKSLLQGSNIKQTGRQRNRVDKGPETFGSSGNSTVSDDSWMKDAEHLVDYSSYLPMKVYVYMASICKLGVDCIVNAANGHLSHGAGVAYAIAKDAGDELTKEGDEHIRSNGPVPVGKVAVTKAGRLNYRFVIHAVGPKWIDYDTSTSKGVADCGQHLYDAVLSSFIKANELGMRSIALPAISSAIFGVPIKYCTMKYAKAVLDFLTLFNGNTSLKEIHFVDVNLVTVQEIQYMFDRMIRNKEPEPFDELNLPSSSLSHSRRERSKFESSFKQKATNVSPNENTQHVAIKPFSCNKTTGKSGDVTLKLQSHELNQTINCYKGDIFLAEVNSLVVVIDKDCRPGKIGSELKRKMNYETQQLYASKLKQAVLNAKTGSVIEITGNWHNYKSVLHVVLPYEVSTMAAQQRKELMRETYKMLFEKVYMNPMTRSVAMTPLAVYTSDPKEIRLGAEMFWNGFLDHCVRIKKDVQPVNLHLVCFEGYGALKTIELLEEANKSLEKLNEDKPTSDIRTKSDMFMQVSVAELKEDDRCVICMDKITQPKKLLCGHIFCAECIDQSLSFKECCPTCGRVCGIIRGDQPPGKMSVTRQNSHFCYGYEKFGKICIKYTFYDGNQLDYHPSPGSAYTGITRSAFLPDNEQGRNVCRMLKVAFQRKLVFTIGHSHTTGQDGAITWNDIHHKTDYRLNTQFGYPDPTYLDRVTEELKAKSITFANIDPNSVIEEALESN